MTIIDYVIEDLERVACLASVPEQQRRIIGDQIGRLRAYQSGGIENASIKAELAALQASYDRLRDRIRTIYKATQVMSDCHPRSCVIQSLGKLVEELESEGK